MKNKIVNSLLCALLLVGVLALLGARTLANLAQDVTGILPVVNGGTATATPSLVGGSNVTITGTWPNQTINAAAVPLTASPAINYTGMFLWLSADCITLSDASTCATPANGTALTAWMDRSGNGGGVVKSGGTCTFNTAQQNGQPAVTFASSCNFYYSVPYSWGGAWTVFAVFKRTSGGGPLFTTIHSGGSGMPYYWYGKGGAGQGVDAQGNSTLGNGTATADTSWHQINVNCDSFGNPAFRIAQATDVTISGASCNSFTGGSIGASYATIGTFGSEVLSMQLAELIVYSRKLSSTEITDTETYLNAKYAL